MMAICDYSVCNILWNAIVPISRIWGLLTSIFLFGVGVDLCYFHQLAGGFTIAASLITFILETSWATGMLLFICTRNENHWIFSIWDAISWIDTWKKAVIYSVLAIVLFAQPHRIWLSTLSGFTLIILGILHVGIMYYDYINIDVCLLEQQEDHVESSPTAVQENLDRCIPQVIIHTEEN